MRSMRRRWLPCSGSIPRWACVLSAYLWVTWSDGPGARSTMVAFTAIAHPSVSGDELPLGASRLVAPAPESAHVDVSRGARRASMARRRGASAPTPSRYAVAGRMGLARGGLGGPLARRYHGGSEGRPRW